MSKPEILVVEDNEEQADVFAEWLRSRYRVSTAYTASEAADAIGSTVDVVLLDRELSGGTGDELLQTFRGAGYDGQVAMVTGHEPDFDIIEMGFDDYLQKPVSAADLRDLVRSLLSRRLYDDKVQRYYELAAKRSALEVEMDERTLERNDEYAKLVSELRALEDLLADLVADLSEDDFLQEFRDVKRLAADRQAGDDEATTAAPDRRVEDRSGDDDRDRI